MHDSIREREHRRVEREREAERNDGDAREKRRFD
jgi:hypothetical protein